ncbi:MAG: hypothetical protein D4R43_00505 [Sphingobacteriales bacterium]|nr:MAG: hypothetical protein D4R43_00505 [Sphingobacteriales bacterium]
MHFKLKIVFFFSVFVLCNSSIALSQIIQLEFPLPIDSTHFKENKLKRISLCYSNYYLLEDNSVSKTMNKMVINYFVIETKIVKLIGISETINTNSFDFSIPECERAKHDSSNSIVHSTDSGKKDSTKIYYTGKRIYRVDLLDYKNQLTGMYLYTYNDYKTLKKIFFYELDSNNDLFLSEKIVLTYR